jgi:hypothetical protein
VLPDNHVAAAPDKLNNIGFDAVCTMLLLPSTNITVTVDNDTLSATIVDGEHCDNIFTGWPTEDTTVTLLPVRPVADDVTVKLPVVKVARVFIVATPDTAETCLFPIVPSLHVPAEPVMLNVIKSVAPGILLPFKSVIRTVMVDTATPSAMMFAGSAVVISFVAAPTVSVTFVVPFIRPALAAVIIAVPGTVPDLNVIVAIPATAGTGFVPMNVPWPPVTLNVTELTALVTNLFLSS